MKKVFFCIFILCALSTFISAQEYIVDDNPGRFWSFSYYTGTTQVTSLTGGDWHSGYYDLALPAPNQFYFYGRLVTHLRICIDGYVVLGFGSASGVGTDWANDPIPRTTTPDSIVAVLWDDYNLTTPTNDGQIWYRITNNPGYPFTVVEWRNVDKCGSGGDYNFSVAFAGHTHTNIPDGILMGYSDVVEGTSGDYGAAATIGVEHYEGSVGEEYSYNTASVNNGDKILYTPFMPAYDTTDFFSNGTPDLVVFRPSNGVWYEWDPVLDTMEAWQFGTRGDIAIPGDFDGDGDADWCVYRPSNSVWYGSIPNFATPFGTSGDIPVVGHWDSDGKTDIAVYRPSTGYWYVQKSGGGGEAIGWGTEGDVPIPGDYDGDGVTDAAVYRPSTGYWYIKKSTNPATSWAIPWGGFNGDVPLTINYSSSAHHDICIFRPSNGVWYVFDPNTSNNWATAYGTSGDVPVPQDRTAGGVSEATVFRPWEGIWYNNVYGAKAYGTIGDKPRSRRSYAIIAPNFSGDEDSKKK